MANSKQRLQAVLATLEKCRATLVEDGAPETAHIVSVATLQLRMKLNQISDAELKALCDAMLPDDGPEGRSRNPKSAPGQRRRPPVLLRLVK